MQRCWRKDDEPCFAEQLTHSVYFSHDICGRATNWRALAATKAGDWLVKVAERYYIYSDEEFRNLYELTSYRERSFSPMEYIPRCGDTIDEVEQGMIKLSSLNGCPVMVIFNGIKLYAYPATQKGDIVNDYHKFRSNPKYNGTYSL